MRFSFLSNRSNAIAGADGSRRASNGGASCHGGPQADTSGLPLIALVGSPNVGKSSLFHKLTGLYATVSNYPGTTVEVLRGRGRMGDREVAVVDTPGMYSLLPVTEEERVARSILLAERPAAVVHVVDAKNLGRMLPLTLQLVEAHLPVILAMNVMDEAEGLGIRIDVPLLERSLGVPVIPTISTTGRGLDSLRHRLGMKVNGHVGNCHCACTV